MLATLGNMGAPLKGPVPTGAESPCGKRSRASMATSNRPRVDTREPASVREPTVTARAEQTELDDVDRELLNAVQWDFPLEPRPYAVLGERLGISEPEVRERIAKVKDAGVLPHGCRLHGDTRPVGCRHG